jgi:hypothetical protein
VSAEFHRNCEEQGGLDRVDICALLVENGIELGDNEVEDLFTACDFNQVDRRV